MTVFNVSIYKIDPFSHHGLRYKTLITEEITGNTEQYWTYTLIGARIKAKYLIAAYKLKKDKEKLIDEYRVD